MDPSKNLSKLLGELELTKKRDMVLEASYNAGKIGQLTYEYIKKDLTKTLVDLEARIKILTRKDEPSLVQDDVEGTSKSNNSHHVMAERARESIQSPKVDANYPSKPLKHDLGNHEMDVEQVKLGKDIPTSVASFPRTETESKKETFDDSQEKEDRPERGFHFYEGLGRPTGQIALSLEDFTEKVSKISLVSLKFHQERGDFANWIRETFNEYSLAEAIGKINEQGENLRRKINEIISLKHYILQCPNCGKTLNPQKTWKMAGKPNKVGKSLQLTIGYYKCLDCKKSFREVLAKEII